MVDLGDKRLGFWSGGFVYQTKKVNACGHISSALTMAYCVNSKKVNSNLLEIHT